MKQLNFISCLVLMVAFIVSCEKESVVIPENLEVNDQQTEMKSFSEFLKSGIDVEEYLTNASKNESKTQVEYSSKTPLGDSDLFDDMAELTSECPSLPIEDFEEANVVPDRGVYCSDPLDEYTNNDAFSPGDILPGISFSTPQDWDPNDFFVFDVGWRGGDSKLLVENNAGDDFVMDFTSITQTVGMEIYSFPFLGGVQDVTVEIRGGSGILHTLNVVGTISGTFFGITTSEPIVKITLSSTNINGWPGVDNVIFGNCDSDDDSDDDGVPNADDNCPNTYNPIQEDYDGDGLGDVCDDDKDGDGCLDVDDDNDFSNMEATVNIDGCDYGVANKMTFGVPCGIMMSDMIDVLEAVTTYKNHGQFVRAMAALVEGWYLEGLISLGEKDLIMMCAGESSYGHK